MPCVPDALSDLFLRTWEPLLDIGVDPGSGAVDRFAWTGEDARARTWFCTEAARHGLEVSTDRNGNLWAWWGPPAPGAVVTGSHLDSVPGGGAYDGPLGVVSALCAVALLRERGVVPARSIAVTVFADEEGARFGVACAGSRMMTGSLDPARARDLVDRDGTTLAVAVAGAGLDPAELGRDDAALQHIGAFVELHVEQGRALADLGAPVAVASGVWPHGRWRLTFRGSPDHAGTTQLPDRRDPVLPFATAALAAREAAELHAARATFGRVEVHPGATNGIAARVDAWLDARAADDGTLDAVVGEVGSAARRAAALHGVEVSVQEESRSPAVAFDDRLSRRVGDAVRRVTGSAPVLPTGAGHDAGVLSAHVPAAMLFVRNPTGTSHSPAETAELADCLTGVRVLAEVLEELSCG